MMSIFRIQNRSLNMTFMAAVSCLGMLAAIFACYSLSYASCSSIKGSIIDLSLFSPAGDGSKDDSTKLQEAADCLVEKANASGTKSGILIIPPGKFRLDRSVEIKAKKGKLESIVIKGAGSGVTALQSNNVSGCLYIDFPNYRTGVFEIYDMRFEALREHGGTAIKVAQPAQGNQHRRNFVARNIEISHTDGSEGYFDFGIHIFGSWRPLIDNVLMTGPFGKTAINTYAVTTCFHLEESYSPLITNSYCWSAKTGVHVLSKTAKNGPEGLTISQSKFVKTDTGIKIDSGAKEPEVFIVNNHVNSREKGIFISNRKFVFIDNNLMYNGDKTKSSYTDIYIRNSEMASITNNIFQNSSMNKHQDRTAVLLDSGTKNSQLSGNMFNSEGRGILIKRGALNNRVLNNLYFAPAVKIDDQDPSGNQTVVEER